jgi:hypothetical protein
MEEVFPVLAGVALGLATHHLTSTRLRVLILGVSSLILGATASYLSGELAISWVYIAIDAVQVLVAAGLTAVLAALWGRRAWRFRA